MELTPREKDKLLIFTAALLAERRRARGLQPGDRVYGVALKCRHFRSCARARGTWQNRLEANPLQTQWRQGLRADSTTRAGCTCLMIS